MRKAPLREVRTSRVKSQACRRSVYLSLTASLLALGLLFALPEGDAKADSPKEDRLATNVLLRPFQWREQGDPAERQKASPQTAPKQGYGLPGMNLFRWTNDASADSKASNSQNETAAVQMPARRALHTPPPHEMSAAVATDGPEQPRSVLAASLEATANKTQTEKQIAIERAPIDWPLASGSAESRRSSSGQGSNPFGWSNAAPRTDQQLLPPQSTLASEEMKHAKKRPG